MHALQRILLALQVQVRQTPLRGAAKRSVSTCVLIAATHCHNQHFVPP